MRPALPSEERRIVLVTGAARGIGRAIALDLAGLGWGVVAVGRSPQTLAGVVDDISAAGARAVAVAADIRNPAETDRAVAEAEERLGPITALVNNAGVQRLASALTVTEADWDAVLDTNLKGAFFTAQAVGRRMVERGGGAIVNIASAAGIVAVPDRTAYSASKAGLMMITKMLAREWAELGIRVNAVAPTFVDTELGRQTLAQPGRQAEIVGRIPMGRLASTDDVTAAVRFLLDPSASGFVTGHVLTVDGGLTLG